MKRILPALGILLLACAAGIRAQPVHVVLFTHIEDNTPAADLSTPQALF